MKKKASYLIIVLLLSLFTSTMRASENNPVLKNAVATEIPVEIKTMLNRLDEIKAMDKSDLKSNERKELRKEVREIKREVRASGNGLYISSGAIIIILLLIIIL